MGDFEKHHDAAHLLNSECGARDSYGHRDVLRDYSCFLFEILMVFVF